MITAGGNNATEFTDQAVQSELISLKEMLSSSLPTLESYSQSSLNADTTTGALSQTIADWDLPTQMENLNTNMATSFAAQSALSQTMVDWDLPGQMNLLNTNIGTSFAAQGAISQTVADWDLPMQMDTLTAVTSESFASEKSLIESLSGKEITSQKESFDILNGNLNELFGEQNQKQKEAADALTLSINDSRTPFERLWDRHFGWLSNSDVKSKNQWDELYKKQDVLGGLSEENKHALGLIEQGTQSGLTGVNDKITEQNRNHGEKLDNINTGVENSNKTTESIETIEEGSKKLAQKANQLAQIGNALSSISIGLDMVGLTIAATTAANPLVALAAGVVAAAGIATATFALGNINVTDDNKYAAGGFPATGQYFLAREAGPELVGTIGSRSAVVNNDQIVESVSAGVARAVSAVLGSGGSAQTIQVYIGNEQLDEYITKSQRRRALQTNGVYA